MQITLRLVILLLSFYYMIVMANGYYPDADNNNNISTQTSSSAACMNRTSRDLQATNDLMTALNATTYKKFANSSDIDYKTTFYLQRH